MINVVCGIRSTGRICTDLAEALEKEGHEVKVAYGREDVPDQFKNYAVRIGANRDVKLHGVKARLLDACGFGSKKATKKFIKWIKEYDPDVIHIHNLHGYYINIEELFNYLRVCGKRILWTLHDCWAFTGHSAYCDAVGCEKWKTGCGECPNIREYPKSFTDHSKRNWILKKEIMVNIPRLTIITPSKWLARCTRESFLQEYPVEVVHNGVDVSKFYPRKSDFKRSHGMENKIILLGVATTWNEMKGYSDYIELAQMLDDNYQLVIVGLSESQIRHLPSSIFGIKQTNSVEELAEIYSSADFLVNLSYCETYPTVNLESIACGTPVITYDTGGSPESLIDNYGIIVKKGDIQSIYSAIEKYRISDNKQFKESFVIERIDKNRATKEYIYLYEQLNTS